MLLDISNQTAIEQSRIACAETLNLQFLEIAFTVHSNNKALLNELAAYYKSYQKQLEPKTHIDLFAVECEVDYSKPNWAEVPRETGKTGRKESFCETEAGRIILKSRTGMCMLQRSVEPMVMGRCSDHIAQVINFINNQFLNHYQNDDYILGHASAFLLKDEVVAVAASSGGGKSSLMLRFMEQPETSFISNDRVLIKQKESGVELIGLAKLPRVNPGTLLNSLRLKHLLSDEYQSKLNAMPTSALWELEDKYDVQIADEYGDNRVELSGPLNHLILLDWSIQSDEPTRIEKIDLAADPDKVAGLAKRPGPFYQNKDGEFVSHHYIMSNSKYVEALKGVNVYRLTGGVDFDQAVASFIELLDK